MSVLATCVLRGEAAYLVAAQAIKLGSKSGTDIYQLRTDGALRLAVFDPNSRALVVFDTEALITMGLEEIREASSSKPPGTFHQTA